ncbi:GNAT family N-acetyltransferase [Sinorhizobium medicae]|nr:GNAT family N-acetyltransferase [Sinorhizobium medicae]
MPDPSAALSCQRNMRHWYLARVEAAGGEVVRTDRLAWGYVTGGLRPPGAGRIVPFPEEVSEASLAALSAYFAESGTAAWCTLGAPLTPTALRQVLKRKGFRYEFPAVCMARCCGAPMRKIPQPACCDIRDVHGFAIPDDALHPSYGPMRDPSARATWRAAVALATGPSPAERMLGAFVEDRLIGTVSLHLDGNAAGIYDLATVPEWRRRGVASWLLGEAIALAERADPAWIVIQNDVSLVGFYESFGFATVASLEHWTMEPAADSTGDDAATQNRDTAIEDLATAAILDQPDHVKSLLAARPELARAPVPGTGGATVLHLAAYHGASRAVAALVHAGAAADARDAQFGSTPLGWAIHGLSPGGPVFKRDQAGAAEALVAAGAVIGEEERAAMRRLSEDIAQRLEEVRRDGGI